MYYSVIHVFLSTTFLLFIHLSDMASLPAKVEVFFVVSMALMRILVDRLDFFHPLRTNNQLDCN